MDVVLKEDTELAERERLSPDAQLSSNTEGRARSGNPDILRTEYQRDRDKIIHSKAFRRLSHKTQVFIAPAGDHFRTRLTHTLEVSQIARTIARGLALNEDLTEAIALGHDLGHTPFGHTGEEAIAASIARHRGLDALDPNATSLFQHNVQSLRVVEVIENDGKGLNLTSEVRDGILCHTGPQRAETMEGRIVAIADRIAYVNHDIDDSIRAGLLDEADLPASTHRVLGEDHSSRIQTLVLDTVRTSASSGDIRMGEPVWDAMLELRSFLFENVYRCDQVMREVRKGYHLVQDLFEYYLRHIDRVPREYRDLSPGDDVQAVCDYVAGMTDRYARTVFEELFIPQPITGM